MYGALFIGIWILAIMLTISLFQYIQGKKKYLLNKHSVNKFNLNPINLNPVIIRKYTTYSNNQPPDDKNDALFIYIVIMCCTNVLMYKK